MAVDHVNIEPKQNVFPTQLSVAGFTTLVHAQSPPDMRESLMQRKKEWKVITGLIDYIQNILLLQMFLETYDLVNKGLSQCLGRSHCKGGTLKLCRLLSKNNPDGT